jgi:glycosyltransferase involved in cell wall biosynthesis
VTADSGNGPHGDEAAAVQVALDVGQLRRPVPGGIGRYVAGLVAALPGAGVEVVPFRGGRVGDLAWHRWRRPHVRVAADVVHAPSLAVPPAGKRPLVVTIHDLAFLDVPDAFTARGRTFHAAGLRVARAEAACIVTPTAWVRDRLVAEGFDAARITPIHHGIDVPDPPAERRVRVGPPYVLAVGTVEPRKRLDAIAAAVAAARRDLPDLELLVAGPPGWGEVPLPDEPWLQRTGRIDEATLDTLYRGAAALVQASEHEGFGLPLLEAMARGCPVVAVAAASAPEVVGDAGLLVAPGDDDALAAAIVRIVDDESTRRVLVGRGLDRAAAATWATSATAHAAVYRHSLG